MKTPKQKALKIAKMNTFMRALTPAARTLVKNPVAKVEAGFVGLQKAALWPAKPWYQRTFAKFFNQMVADGVVRNVLSIGAIQLCSSGEMPVMERVGEGLTGYVAIGHKELGPDAYGILFVFMHSDLSIDDLKEKYRANCFGSEGEVVAQFPMWADVSPVIEK